MLLNCVCPIDFEPSLELFCFDQSENTCGIFSPSEAFSRALNSGCMFSRAWRECTKWHVFPRSVPQVFSFYFKSSNFCSDWPDSDM